MEAVLVTVPINTEGHRPQDTTQPVFNVHQVFTVCNLVRACVTCVRASPETQEIRWLGGENEKQNSHKQRHAGIGDEPAEDNINKIFHKTTTANFIFLTFVRLKWSIGRY